jgi:hypothetical protein
MFARMIDDFKNTLGRALRLTSLAAAAGFALFITAWFLCAAAFVFVLQRYGLIEACLAGAGVFFVVALIAAGGYLVQQRQRQAKARVAEKTKSPFQTALADPMVVAAGLQVVRSIGIKRLIPILAIGGLALGFLVSRGASGGDADEAPAE